MLYNNFIVCVMTCSALSLMLMISNGHYQYIIIPIGALIWGFYKFFNDNDREFLRRLGVNPDEFNAFFPDDYYSESYNTARKNNTTTSKPTTNNSSAERAATWANQYNSRSYGGGYFDSPYYGGSGRGYQNPLYKNIAKKCKRNFKITIDKEINNDNKESRTASFFHSICSNKQ